MGPLTVLPVSLLLSFSLTLFPANTHTVCSVYEHTHTHTCTHQMPYISSCHFNPFVSPPTVSPLWDCLHWHLSSGTTMEKFAHVWLLIHMALNERATWFTDGEKNKKQNKKFSTFNRGWAPCRQKNARAQTLERWQIGVYSTTVPSASWKPVNLFFSTRRTGFSNGPGSRICIRHE